MKKRLFLFLPLTVLAVMMVLFALVLGQGEKQEVSVITGDIHIDRPLPTLSLPSLEGAEWMTQAALSSPDKIVVVNFFASWCQPCLIEHPSLLKLAKNPDIRLIGIGWRDKPDALRQWLMRQGNPYEMVFVDNMGQSSIPWGLSGVPETFVIDKKGRMRGHIVGPVTDSMLVEALVAELRS